MSRKYFGTDGIRGRVGQYPITPEFCLRLGWAVGTVFAQRGRAHIVIGKDTRISGYMLESVLESGLVSAGADVSLIGPMPTPAIAYLTRTVRADAGIVISASHNPYYDNGIKFFDRSGTKLDDDLELEIEQKLEEKMISVDSDRLGRASRLEDASGRYIEFCKASVPRGFSLRGVRIVVDCGHGATYHVAPRVFEELGADVFALGTEPNGKNINDGYGSTEPENLQAKVLEVRADVGIGFDGDGDRVVMVDDRGQLADGDALLYVIAKHRQQNNQLDGGVVGTVMTNLGLEQALASMSIPFERAQVGDRYVTELLNEKGWSLGGESSGHILCTDLNTTGDAIIAALQVLCPMVESGASLADLVSGMSKLPQVMINVTVDDPKRVAVCDELKKAIEREESQLGGRGRTLVRASGTEPLLRVMVEGEDGDEVQEIANRLAIVAEGQN
ncbi:MAG: phosphoglucosamine mutase [Pseudomonadales bacterium]|nr:phosphoglucosamine mutase [Pseudomonadales bacterium]